MQCLYNNVVATFTDGKRIQYTSPSNKISEQYISHMFRGDSANNSTYMSKTVWDAILSHVS